MTGLTLALSRARLENRAFWRNPAAAFFTVVFPLVLLVIATVALAAPLGGSEQAARFYTPSMMAFAVVTACYTNLAMGVVLAREAVRRGARNLTLEVRVSNEAAKGLYRRFGLAPAGIRKGYYVESGEDAIVMWAHDIDDDAYSDRLRRLWDDVPGTTLVEHPR